MLHDKSWTTARLFEEKKGKNGDVKGNSCDYSEGDCGNVVADAGTFIEEQLQLPTVPDVGLLHTSS